MTIRRKDRARRDEAKAERRQAILDASWATFQDAPYQSITMADVAERIQLAKGTIYLYFKTKEELFLQLTQDQLEAWFDELDEALQDRRFDSAGLAAYLAGSLDGRAGLVRLLAILHSVIEQNVEFEAGLEFKEMLVRRMSRSGDLLEASLGFLAEGEGALLLLRIHALIVGLYSMVDPPPGLAGMLNEPGMDILQVDFDREFSQTILALLRGMEKRDNG